MEFNAFQITLHDYFFLDEGVESKIISVDAECESDIKTTCKFEN